jgi:formylmethanofuran dehydrogenase subunit E
VVKTGYALRLSPRLGVRQSASRYAPGETRHYFAQLHGYQVMPEDELFTASTVKLRPSAVDIISQAGVRTECTHCGEEIINEREVMIAGMPYCQACCGRAYYVTETVSRSLYKQEKVLIT